MNKDKILQIIEDSEWYYQSSKIFDEETFQLMIDELVDLMEEYAQEYSNSTGRRMEE